ncbi:hypothetical protein HYPSUDRAFT_210205 [Hypholoma sublateritium FD-334 SS-4]|uniref:Uncharacterized protein n=1 Tax=Hypholoma sublateritium (strain FD-334 SS-4) TaxID=945553 RepID=A0A0D2NW09_HYPSF|nr:hypothetical protein HYPSUDRAFT_210205 [Hypholoma sublateritium FD-334 SS-4]
MHTLKVRTNNKDQRSPRDSALCAARITLRRRPAFVLSLIVLACYRIRSTSGVALQLNASQHFAACSASPPLHPTACSDVKHTRALPPPASANTPRTDSLTHAAHRRPTFRDPRCAGTMSRSAETRCAHIPRRRAVRPPLCRRLEMRSLRRAPITAHRDVSIIFTTRNVPHSVESVPGHSAGVSSAKGDVLLSCSWCASPTAQHAAGQRRKIGLGSEGDLTCRRPPCAAYQAIPVVSIFVVMHRAPRSADADGAYSHGISDAREKMRGLPVHPILARRRYDRVTLQQPSSRWSLSSMRGTGRARIGRSRCGRQS